ncbi:MAG: transcriptional regulator GcvA [Azoarcus sp. PHD]|nr:MAG: transcriptional regulator GcvA [Azoarcus sp. PHD]
MSYELPSLALLRTFEAAARHLSFKKAADEICVTPAAVSQQMKALEEYLGVPLFHRRVRALELTEHGSTLLPGVRDAFERLAVAVDHTRRVTPGPLTVTAPPSFASHWLLPRLPRFNVAHPDIELRLSSTSDTVDHKGEAAVLGKLHPARTEVAILYGKGHYPGYVVVPIFTPDYVPVCTPALQRAAALQTPANLAGQVLIHDDTLSEDGRDRHSRSGWAEWLRLAGASNIDSRRGPHFSNAALALEAAQAGHGIALAPRPLIDSRVAEGKLVVPFNITLPSPSTYYLVMHEAMQHQPAVDAFQQWLLAEASALKKRQLHRT